MRDLSEYVNEYINEAARRGHKAITKYVGTLAVKDNEKTTVAITAALKLYVSACETRGFSPVQIIQGLLISMGMAPEEAH